MSDGREADTKALEALVRLNLADRFKWWIEFVRAWGLRKVAEVGVYRGEFARRLLSDVPGIDRYWMIDPWRALPDWNKPANTDDATFDEYYRDALRATEFAADKRIVLRGRTTEVVDRIDDASLDFVYIDGDHTLRGIAIDLIAIFPKVREGGWLTGDDFCNSIWQHPRQFEPTLVFPFAAYFAEAHGMVIYALPHNQFAIRKTAGAYTFIDLTDTYGDLSLLRQVS